MEPDAKRAKLFMKNPNPKYVLWLEEWLLEAHANNDQRRAMVLNSALESLRKYPVRLKCAKECIILDKFSSRLIEELESREKSEASTGLQEASIAHPACIDDLEICEQKPSEVDVGFGNLPLNQVGDWIEVKSPYHAVLVGMLLHMSSKNNKDGPVPKKIMGKISNVHSEKRITPTEMKKTLKRLEDSALLSVSGEPPTYRLTDTGKQCAERLCKASGLDVPEVVPASYEQQRLAVQELIAPSNSRSRKKDEINARVVPPEEDPTPVTINTVDFPAFQPFSFDIIMLIDTAEKGFLSSVQEFTQLGVEFEVRHLKVGDYAWVARDREKRELLLPFLVERKRLDDLLKSVMDGRFSEQKFRLQMSTIPNIVFLIELCEIRSNMQTASQAISNMLIKDLFTVKETKNNVDAIKYLANLTRYFNSLVKCKTLVHSQKYENGCSLDSQTLLLPEFNTFFAGMEKNRTFTTKEMFTKQLVQLHGLSADRAWSIATKYQTPKALIEAFLDSGPTLLSSLNYGLLNKRIGDNISTNLHKFYTSLNFH